MDVPSYTARFREHAARTQYSEVDLRSRYYDHLSEKLKDALASSDRDIKSYESLITAATAIDARLRERAE